MLKIIVILFTIAMSIGVKTYAQVNEQGLDTVGRPDIPAMKQQKSIAEQQLIKIKNEDLPESVIKALHSHGYSDWIIQNAYKNIVLKQYSVRLKRGNEIVFYTFDANGNRIKE